MNLEHKRLSVVIFFTLFAVLCFPVLLAGWRLMFCSPLLVILFYQKNYITCLWWSLLLGLLLDFLSSNTHLGMYAVSFCLTSALLYGQRRNFFADSITTLPLMTFFFSAMSTVFQLVFMYTFEQINVFSWDWILSDLLYLPALDSLYAFMLFIFPFLIFGKKSRAGKDYFLEGR